MKTLTIELFIHKVYSRQGGFIAQYYEGILLNAAKGHFDYGKKIGDATGDTEQEVIDELTRFVRENYEPSLGDKFRIIVLK
jgi:predicted PolB exonuclease-like 3'-5' exonuclease